jgi:hypothetical protein
MPNTELFRKVRDVIAQHPDQFDMNVWEDRYGQTLSSDEACGTTRCVAGWAIHLTTGEPLFDIVDGTHPSVTELSERLGVSEDFGELAAELLEITEEEGNILFHCDRSVARQVVEAFAEGRDEEAVSYLGFFDGWRD